MSGDAESPFECSGEVTRAQARHPGQLIEGDSFGKVGIDMFHESSCLKRREAAPVASAARGEFCCARRHRGRRERSAKQSQGSANVCLSAIPISAHA
jgi:hypothetical protein